MAAQPRPSMDLSTKDQIELREVFTLYDTTAAGYLDYRELRHAMRALGFPVKKKDARHLAHEYGQQSDGFVDFNAFLRIVQLRSRDAVDALADIKTGFRLFDCQQANCITFEDLKLLAHEVAQLALGSLHDSQQVGEYFSHDRLREMIMLADSDGDGKVSRDDFVNVMSQTNLFRQ